jgi:hypothetical protein
VGTIPASENEFPQLLLTEVAAPATPGTGLIVCYAKSDGLLYCKDDAGVETAYAAASTDLAAHLADTADAHDASAISVLDTGAVFTGTDVETVLAELQAAIAGGGIPATIIDAKGDLIGGTAADTAGRLAVGTNGQALTAQSGQATGLQWADMIGEHTHAATGVGATGGGATLSPETLNAAGLFTMNDHIVSTVNADQNDYAPTGIHTKTLIRFDSFTANRTVTGISAGVTGEVLILINNTAFSLLLPYESASSTAANRFRNPAAGTVTVRAFGGVFLIYLNSRWSTLAI